MRPFITRLHIRAPPETPRNPEGSSSTSRRSVRRARTSHVCDSVFDLAPKRCYFPTWTGRIDEGPTGAGSTQSSTEEGLGCIASS